jgi:hypothetical protein
MRIRKTGLLAVAAVLIGAFPAMGAAEDPAKAKPSQTREAKQEVKDGAREAGREVRQGAQAAGHEIKQTAKETKSGVKRGWHEIKEGAAEFGRNVKGFFSGLFRG